MFSFGKSFDNVLSTLRGCPQQGVSYKNICRYLDDMAVMIPAWIEGKLQPVEKLESHVRGLRHKAVSVFLIHEGKVLIQQRAGGKYHTPHLWANTCCTHPNWNEDPEDCARRRLKEELGIRDAIPNWAEALEYRANVGDGLIEHEVVDLFSVHTDTRPKLRLNPDEVQAVDWLDRTELESEIARAPDKFTPWLKIYMSNFASSVFGPA